ncbi:AFR342Cp [Eremothecium gossypii ATCC 10895]|uniref:AFR342Cp n=1 Tax=Eremothecium gossypii (strain ATCC 10895 / CBS 109.51 / FGSC 9923 / NRRL Y-1056) TaxID=284811 RepID=Q753H0_EREGS|nr:pumilio-family RNA binding domain-containing protein [Eremothecium gossypii ATCC 10895]AAS53713.1 AFR342Cp [Eremothecium gossypii ATCC 10895]
MAPVIKRPNKRQAKQPAAKKARVAVHSSDEEYPSSDDEAMEDVAAQAESEESDALDDSDSEEEEIKQKDGEEAAGSASDGEGEKQAGGEGSQHAGQRKLLKERKMQRKSGAQVQHIKALWEKLRVKQPPMPREVREKLSNEVWELSKDCIADLVLKHDASRVVQTLVKYSSKERRNQIVESLKGKFYVLATSSYGKYLLVKLLHYGSRESRQLIIDELHGKLRKLMRHREGAYVVEDLYVLYASQEQKQQMIREFWGAEYAVFRDAHKNLTLKEVCEASVEKRNIIARNLIGTITASVEKGSTGFQILHAAMGEYIKICNEKEISEFIELVHEHFAELVHTPEGAEVACVLIARASAKERKAIIKNLKDHAENLLKNQHGNQVFVTLLMTVDDTVLTFKAFAPAIKDKLKELVVDKWARRPFLYILLGLHGKYFSPLVKKDVERYVALSATTSKKPAEQRKLELLKKFGPLLISCVGDDYAEIMKDNMGCQFIEELLLNDTLYENLSSEETLKFQELVDAIATSFKGDISEEEHPISRPYSARLLKAMIQGGKWNSAQKKLEPLSKVQGLGTTFAAKFYQDIIDSSNLLEWIQTPNSSFTIVALYETLVQRPEGKQFVKDLKAISKDIPKDDEGNKGAKLLSKLLSEKK